MRISFTYLLIILFAFTTGCKEKQQRLFGWAESLFGDPNSPVRNEDLYIAVLEAFIEDSLIQEEQKIRPRYLLKTAQKNRPGSTATDFELWTVQGKRMKLSEVASPYLLLYFFNPDCQDCGRVTKYLQESPLFQDLQRQQILKVVAVYPDEDLEIWKNYRNKISREWIAGRFVGEKDRDAFYLPAIPMLYLLDKDKKVLLKDATVEYIERWLMQSQK